LPGGSMVETATASLQVKIDMTGIGLVEINNPP
jgi:hypothetical protein